MNQQPTPPVEVGDEIVVTIEAVGGKGDGIAKVKGFVLFVANTKKGQRVKVKISKVLPKVGFADVVEVMEPEAPKEVTFKESELSPEPEEQYEDTEDFGEDIQEDQ